MAMFWSICSRQRVQQYTGSCSISFNGSRLVDLYMIPRGNLDSQPQMPCLDEIAMKSLYITEEYKNFYFDLAAIPKYEGVMWQRMRAQCSSFNAWIILKCRWSKMDKVFFQWKISFVLTEFDVQLACGLLWFMVFGLALIYLFNLFKR